MTELENDHHGYDWFNWEASEKLKLVGEKPEEEWNILQGLRISPHKILITKNKKETLQWKKSTVFTLIKQTNLISPVVGQLTSSTI